MGSVSTGALTLNITPPAPTGGATALGNLADGLTAGQAAVLPCPTWNPAWTPYASWQSANLYDATNNRFVFVTKEAATGQSAGAGLFRMYFYTIATDTWTMPYEGFPNTAEEGHPWNMWGISQDNGAIYYWQYGSSTSTIRKWAGESTGLWATTFTHTNDTAQYGYTMAWDPNLFGPGQGGFVYCDRAEIFCVPKEFTGDIETRKLRDWPGMSGGDAQYNSVMYCQQLGGVICSRYHQNTTHVNSAYTYPLSGRTIETLLIKGGTPPTYVRLRDVPTHRIGPGSGSSTDPGPRGMLVDTPLVAGTQPAGPLIFMTGNYEAPNDVFQLQGNVEDPGASAWTRFPGISPFHLPQYNQYDNRVMFVSYKTKGVICGLVRSGNEGAASAGAAHLIVWKPSLEIL